MNPLRPATLGRLLGAFVLIAMAARAENDNRLPVQVRVEGGLIEGSYDTGTHLETYLGVPYAKPPVGELRWQPPQPVEAWSGVRTAKAFGPRAVQPPVYSDMIFRSAGLSEDCLYLNIWRFQRSRSPEKQPVLVYFYGGGFLAGDGSEIRYDGANMAQKGIVIVTVNYRLNVFGFLALPELSAESPHHASGNYGIMDQAAALAWVKRNIAAFGGDPERVTIAGESAGSISVSMLMASPLSKGLFAQAIGESGAAIPPTFFPVPLADAEKDGLAFAKQAGGLSLKQLRAMSTRELYDLYESAQRPNLSTALDGYVLTKPVAATFAAGEQAKVPLLVGWNSQEMGYQTLMGDQPLTPATFEARIRQLFGANADALLAVMPHATEAEVNASATALSGDDFIAFSTWKWSDLHRRTSGQPVYRYFYTRVRPPMMEKYGGPGPTGALQDGAVHSSEIEYVLGNLGLSDEYAWSNDDRKVSATCQDYFANFIKTGNPNGKGLPPWPAAGATDAAPAVMRLDVESKAAPSAVEARYQILDRYYSAR